MLLPDKPYRPEHSAVKADTDAVSGIQYNTVQTRDMALAVTKLTSPVRLPYQYSDTFKTQL